MDACGVGLSSRFGSSRKVVSGCFMIFSMSMAVMLLTFSVFLLVTSNSYRLFWGHMLAIFFLVSLYCLHAILFTFVYSNPPWAQTSTLGSQWNGPVLLFFIIFVFFSIRSYGWYTLISFFHILFLMLQQIFNIESSTHFSYLS
jgi:hypothetical protein